MNNDIYDYLPLLKPENWQAVWLGNGAYFEIENPALNCRVILENGLPL